jgi:hypothetical protein
MVPGTPGKLSCSVGYLVLWWSGAIVENAGEVVRGSGVFGGGRRGNVVAVGNGRWGMR